MYTPNIDEFPDFSLERLLSTCFENDSGKESRICILIDLPDLSLMHGNKFLGEEGFSVQKYAHNVFLQDLTQGVSEKLSYTENGFFAFKTTGGSNLDPEDSATNSKGDSLSLSRDIYPNFDIILAITDYSLTAPLTASAKIHGFRGATLHGVNDIILNSGLSVDYLKISKQAELFRSLLDNSEFFELDFEVLGNKSTLRIDCNSQSAQKSHGLCPEGTPDVANLPAGEVYFVPTSASGSFPFRFSDGTIAEMNVEDGAIVNSTLLKGDQQLVDNRNQQLTEDPATGIIGELGFGTQLLPFSGKDIQDEKIIGTCHVATGRSDHLGGSLTPDLFNSRLNASHDDILYAPPKTPEINVSEVRMFKNGEGIAILRDFQPTPYLLDRLSSEYPVDKFVVSAV
jgi:hypothetical protein